MGNLIFALILCVPIGFALTCGVFSTLANSCSRRNEIACVVGIVVIWVVVVFLVALAPAMGVRSSRIYAARYQEQKAIIEQTINDKTTLEFERQKLVEEASKANQDLVERQYNAAQWYGFDQDRDLILSLEKISLKPVKTEDDAV